MQDTENANERASVKRITVGFRYREDLVALVDAVAKRRGVERSDVLAGATDDLLEREFPGSTKEAA